MPHSNASLADLSAAEAAAMIVARDLTSEAYVSACIDRIAERDPDIQAWEYFDPDYALAQARAADQAQSEGRPLGPLHGLPVAIKDIIATKDMPTQNGTPIHQGRQPEEDATCVRVLREAGAIIIGKAVTTELANRYPGKTRNPHNPAYSPGGSSSGSAAAVACGMVPLALGTQTGGSVVRPASYCGIHGLKPTLGMIPRTGVTLQSHTLDTVGVYGRSLADIALICDALSVRDSSDPVSYPRAAARCVDQLADDIAAPPRIAFCHTPAWAAADAAARAAITNLAKSLGDACVEVETPAAMDDVVEVHRIVHQAEAAHHYAPLRERGDDRLSAALRAVLDDGAAITAQQYLDALGRRAPMYRAFASLFDNFDAVLTLSSPGSAPKGLASTGNPVFNGMWTFLGVPTVTLPMLEVDGMPCGAQLIGLRREEGRLLRTARWCETNASR